DSAAIADAAIDPRDGDDLVVHDDRHVFADVRFRVASEALRAVGLDVESNIGPSVFVDTDPSATQVTTSDDGSARQDVPLLGAAIATIARLSRLHNHAAFRQHATLSS